MIVDRVLDHVQRAQAQEVHLQQADLLDRAHRVLRHRLVDALRLAVRCRSVALAAPRSSASWSGTISVSGRSAITTAAAWIELLRTMSSRPARDVDDLLRLGVGVVGLPQLGARLAGSPRSSGCGP